MRNYNIPIPGLIEVLATGLGKKNSPDNIYNVTMPEAKKESVVSDWTPVDNLVTMFDDAVENIGNATHTDWTPYDNAVSAVADAGENVQNFVNEGIDDVNTTIFTPIADAISNAVSAGGDAISNVNNVLNDATDNLTNAVLNPVADTVSSVLEPVATTVGGKIEDVLSGNISSALGIGWKSEASPVAATSDEIMNAGSSMRKKRY